MTYFDLNAGALAPLSSEVDVETLQVSGEIPPDLNGVLLRNGPNPFSGRFEGHDLLSWWPEAAMFHGLYFKNGTVERYRNRWARTRQWANYNAIEDTDSMLDTNPNINIISHAGELLALAEGGRPLVINTELESLGASHQKGISNGVSAHPKKDPNTGELITFRADWNHPWLTYGVTGPEGDLLYSTQIDIQSPMMMHDMAITPTHSMLFDLGVAYDFSMMQQGFNIPIRWYEERQCRIGVIPRFGGSLRWFEVESCFIQHISNAYNATDSTIVIDAVRYPWYMRTTQNERTFEANPLGVLWRYTIDLESGEVDERAIDELGIEFPRINESLVGQKFRYMYAAVQPTIEEIRGVVRYDVNTGTTQKHEVPVGDQNGEPVFVARKGSAVEDDGWVLVYVYRKESDRSDLVILNACDISKKPQAVVHFPHRVPAGFHASWIPLG